MAQGRANPFLFQQSNQESSRVKALRTTQRQREDGDGSGNRGNESINDVQIGHCQCREVGAQTARVHHRETHAQAPERKMRITRRRSAAVRLCAIDLRGI
jgi:hypothetical protein